MPGLDVKLQDEEDPVVLSPSLVISTLKQEEPPDHPATKVALIIDFVSIYKFCGCIIF